MKAVWQYLILRCLVLIYRYVFQVLHSFEPSLTITSNQQAGHIYSLQQVFGKFSNDFENVIVNNIHEQNILESLICRIMVGANATCNELKSSTENSGVMVRNRRGENLSIQFDVILQNFYDHHMSLNKTVVKDRLNAYKHIEKTYHSMSRCRD